MLIRSVTAHAFGPLHGETLRFADGMTVVHGANESAKSTWHAAIYAALCGRRRGRAPSADERRFADLHRPWDRDEWVVSAEVLLDDGRRLEVRQDLAGRVDCDVRDLDLGRDCSDEFIKDGTPDLARWLGLDRHSFLATACVAQAQVLAILDRPGGLQEQLQRAAATAGADQTAAAALAHIDNYRREQVGSDRAPRRPMRVAGAAVTRAAAVLADTRAAHTAYQRRLIEADQLRAAASGAERALRRYEALAAARAAEHEADVLRRRVAEVDALAAEVGDVEPSPSPDDEATERHVAAALSAWDARPAEPEPDLALVDPQIPDPGVQPGPAVDGALPDDEILAGSALDGSAFDGAAVGGEFLAPGFAGSDPAEESVAAELTDQELWDLARDVELTAPPVDPGIHERVAAARTRLADASRARGHGRRLLIGASALAVLAVGVLVVGIALTATPVVGGVVAGVLAVAAAVLGVRCVGATRSGDTSTIRRELDAALLDAAAALRAEQTALAHRDGARSRARRLGLPATADGIRALARTRAGSIMVAERDEQWQRQLSETRQRAEREISATRRQAELRVTETREQARRRISETRQRAEQVRLQAVRAQEQLRAQVVEARRRAADQVVAAARRCGIAVADPDEAVAALLRWQRQRADSNAALEQARRGWTRLQSLVGAGSAAGAAEVAQALAQLRHAARQAQDRATRAAADPDFAPDGDEEGNDSVVLQRLREEVLAANARADLAEGERQAMGRGLASVGEAEEDLARAEAELARLRELDQTLELTRTFLATAQERAHRTIAPVLVDTVGRWLPGATAGRYTSVIVDPEKLRVQVRGPAGRWRDADLLSHGTAEQVYLLLRIALAQHVARPGTVCPLLLDDVTVHADAERTERILELLLAAAGERQIILFTQQDQVRDWARTRLDGNNHATHTLAALTAV